MTLIIDRRRWRKGCHMIWEEEGSTAEVLASSGSSPAVNSSLLEPSQS
jgi:hypothetical protein